MLYQTVGVLLKLHEPANVSGHASVLFPFTVCHVQLSAGALNGITVAFVHKSFNGMPAVLAVIVSVKSPSDPSGEPTAMIKLVFGNTHSNSSGELSQLENNNVPLHALYTPIFKSVAPSTPLPA